MTDRKGVLVMAYGTPKDLDDVEPYYTDIRRGRPPPPELLEELRERYRAIGGKSPLLALTKTQAKGIEERVGLPTYVGQKHAAPFIPDAVADMNENGIEQAVGIVLAPHYSTMSIGDYARRANRAAEETGWSGKLDMVDSWHLEPGYINFLDREVKKALASLPEPARRDAVVLFTAHSLPEKILQAKDPYPQQLEETARAVAEKAGLDRWQVGWQSAGRTDVPWLGPDVLEILPQLADDNVPGVVVCPCGFVSDHLEVLYDVDIEAKKAANDLGIALARTASPNDDPMFLDALAAVVRRALTNR
ncbi:MAG TPA: ferrochelatase [Actinomycetota bacterium]|nr:ferrochelatase [Actinomycetota bacterium]